VRPRGQAGVGSERSSVLDRVPSHCQIQLGNLLVAEATVREIGQVSLVKALELTALIARKARRRHPRVAAR
jgi:hypothetical protein